MPRLVTTLLVMLLVNGCAVRSAQVDWDTLKQTPSVHIQTDEASTLSTATPIDIQVGKRRTITVDEHDPVLMSDGALSYIKILRVVATVPGTHQVVIKTYADCGLKCILANTRYLYPRSRFWTMREPH